MSQPTSNEFGFCRDGKVFINPYLTYSEREIGFVRGSEEEALAYFVKRFDLALSKVKGLSAEIEAAQNKGSFLTKVLQMKTYLIEFDGLGDFKPLLLELEKHEAFLKELIQANQVKNLEIKRALIQDAKEISIAEDVVEATDKLMEVKMKWVKTGPVDKQFQDQLSVEFQEVMDEFFLKRRF